AGRQGWAGVLMPSVDRVGRYFPLTIVRPIGEGPSDTQQMTALWHWLARLDELAADALHDDWTIERLEDELARMAEPELGAPDQASCASPAAPAGTGRTEATLAPAPAQRLLAVTLPPGGDAARHIGAEAQALWRAQAQGRAYWHASTDLGGTRLMLSCGLPTPAQSAGLLAATL
ncbi:MAG: hypothetical protein RLZZ584_4584, partial [Pseudomonadota bacterium]